MSKRNLLLVVLCLFCLTGRAQHYVLDGLTGINCQPGIQVYTIDTDVELGGTEWSIDPPTGATILSSNAYSVTIEFTSPGSYILFSSSNSVIGIPYEDYLFIDVNTPIQLPEIIGCYQYTPGDNCYKVCAHATSTIFTDVDEFTITGADEYILLPDGINITWGESGIGTVLLSGGPCEINICFEILPEPTAGFSTSGTSVNDTVTVCKHQQVLFENTSLNGIVYSWDFGDGDKLESHNATHAYDVEGYYTVTLTAQGICECRDEKSLVIEVLEDAAPQLDCINSICPGSRQRYTATTAGCTTFEWIVSSNGTVVNGGGPSDDFIEIIWHTGPEGIIELNVDDCITESCMSTTIFTIPVITPDGPVEGDASVCSGEIVTYSAPYFPGTTYHWQVGAYGQILGEENMNQVVVKWNEVTQTRNTRVTVRYENCTLGCAGVDFINVSITPTFHLTGDMQVCEKGTASVSALAGFGANQVPAEVQWHIEDDQGQMVYSQPGMISSITYVFDFPPGVYTWVGTNITGTYCNETARLDIQVTPLPAPPQGISGPTVICPGHRYGFNIVASGTYATQWTVTDGASIFQYAGQSIEHTFGPNPPYHLEAVHQDIQFASCISSPVTLDLQPATISAITGPDHACQYSVERYTIPYIPGAEMLWEIIPEDFGEIKTSGTNEADIFWTQAGSATLRLTSCGNVVEKTITIFSKPILNVNYPNDLCENATASITTNQPTLIHRWVNANQNSIGTASSIDLPPGTYGVAVTDANGCTDKKAFTIDSLPAPFVFISTPDDLSYCSVIPAGVEIIANTPGSDYMYNWYLDDVLLGSGGPTLPITNFGTYHVEVVNQYGCRAVSDEIRFRDCCINGDCGFTLPGDPPGCVILPNDFMISANETDCRTQTYTANLTDLVPGSLRWRIRTASSGILDSSTSDVYSYTFPAPGYYHLFLTGLLNGYPYDAAVCGHYASMLVKIPAVADFAYTGQCTGEMIQFEDLSTFLPDESIVSWTWNFDDPGSGLNNVSNLQDLSHVFVNPGTYNVSLTITMASGCTVTANKIITIRQGPALMIDYIGEYCEDEALAFTLEEELYGVVWNFDDPASGAENVALSNYVFHTYDSPGGYFATVRARDIYGCLAQAFNEVDISANLLSGVIAVDPDTRICAGDSALLSAPSGALMWDWNTNQNTANIYAHDAGLYELVMYDIDHCSYRPPPVFISVSPDPVVIIQAREIIAEDLFGPWSSSLELCAGEEFEIQAFSTGVVTYSWNNGSDQPGIQLTNEGANLPAAGDHTFTVVAFDPVTGCFSDSTSIHVLVHQLPVAPIVSLTGPGCSFNDNTLTVTNPEPGVTYLWSDGQTGVSIVVTTAGAYFVVATNPYGCSSASNIISISPSAPVDQIPAGCISACELLNLCLPPIENVDHYTVFHNGMQVYTGTTWWEDYYLFEEGEFTFEITTTNGCAATSDPIYLTLYDGFGDITVETWLDVDGNMIISAGDQLLPGIPVQILSNDGLHAGKTETNANGLFVFSDYPVTGYLATIDSAKLSPLYTIIIDSVQTQIVTCDDSVVVQLLLAQNCTLSGPDYLADLCAGDTLMLGDSLWTEPGIYEMHMMAMSGCDSSFQVHITRPDSFHLVVQIWSDVDQNGIVSLADTLYPGLPVLITTLPSGTTTTTIPVDTGQIDIPLLASAYNIIIDTMQLPPGIVALYYEQALQDTICGQITIAFLVKNRCLPVLQIIQESICPGDSLLFDGEWLLEEGQYTFTHTDPVTLCDTLIDVYIAHYEEPVISGEVAWSCIEFGSILIEPSGTLPLTIQWEELAGDTLVTLLPEGTYIVHVTDANQCVVSDTFEVVAGQLLAFTLEDQYLIAEGDSILVQVEGDIDEPGLEYTWQPPGLFQCPVCPSSWLGTPADTTITVSITDSNGCEYTLSAVVNLFAELQDHLYIPNTFSPNNDGFNDLWLISGSGDEMWIDELMIFDRWGTMVYVTNEIDLSSFHGWDGTFKGEQLNPAVFTYLGRLRSADGQEVQVKGDVTLVR
jgi:gliding motility-associated-like protein